MQGCRGARLFAVQFSRPGGSLGGMESRGTQATEVSGRVRSITRFQGGMTIATDQHPHLAGHPPSAAGMAGGHRLESDGMVASLGDGPLTSISHVRDHADIHARGPPACSGVLWAGPGRALAAGKPAPRLMLRRACSLVGNRPSWGNLFVSRLPSPDCRPFTNLGIARRRNHDKQLEHLSLSQVNSNWHNVTNPIDCPLGADSPSPAIHVSQSQPTLGVCARHQGKAHVPKLHSCPPSKQQTVV